MVRSKSRAVPESIQSPSEQLRKDRSFLRHVVMHSSEVISRYATGVLCDDKAADIMRTAQTLRQLPELVKLPDISTKPPAVAIPVGSSQPLKETVQEMVELASSILQSPEFTSDTRERLEVFTASRIRNLPADVKQFATSVLVGFLQKKLSEIIENMPQEHIDAEVFDLLRPDYRDDFPAAA